MDRGTAFRSPGAKKRLRAINGLPDADAMRDDATPPGRPSDAADRE
jgi:hypothetical protein